ncbi:hypothetical protein TWF694_011471 [Orbilia ellipsospora]|uniref:Uncharacterized protein n=1 Tax=Orbilia ellipsospora TaxID=2528407 RepID=A0AAV9X5B8_9PEZI
MAPITYRSLLSALILVTKASGYTINFYTDNKCHTFSVWQHTVINGTSVGTPCEQLPSEYLTVVQSASITSDSLDPYPEYIIKLFTDKQCFVKSDAKLGLSDTCVNFHGENVESFRIVGKLSNAQLPNGATASSSTTEDVTTNNYGDAVVTETETEEVIYGGSGFRADSSPGSSSGQPVGVIYPLGNVNPSIMDFPGNGAATPGSTDEEDCDDTQTANYLQDSNNDGTADGYLSETTTTDAAGNIVGYDRTQVDYGQDILGAVMRGPSVAQDPTLNDPRLPDAGIDSSARSPESFY